MENDEETSNKHILELECPILSYDHFSESLQEEDMDFEPLLFIEQATQSELQKTKERASKLEFKFPIKVFSVYFLFSCHLPYSFLHIIHVNI